MNGPEHMFWDSCVFLRYLTENPSDYVDDIARFISDAQRGDRKIYYSTICYTEIRPGYLKRQYSDIHELFKAWGRNFIPIEPNPNILIAAGEVRDVLPVNPSDPNTKTNRVIGTPDAIQLMTCLHLRDVLGVDDVVFHSFDKGRSTSWEGKCVPIIGFERWYPEEKRNGHIGDICSLPRAEPAHPDKDLLQPDR